MSFELFEDLNNFPRNFNSQARVDFRLVTVEENELLEDLLHERIKPGGEYSEAVQRHTHFLTGVFMLEASGFSDYENAAIVGIPRGGIPVAMAVMSTMDAIKTRLDVASLSPAMYISQTKSNPDNLFPTNLHFETADTLILADGIIGTGKTIVDHMEQIPADWHGHVQVISNVTAQLGVDAITKAAEGKSFQTTLVTGKVYPEDECRWVEVDGGKNVYFVGADDGIPDFGDHVTPTAKIPSSLKFKPSMEWHRMHAKHPKI